MSYILTIHNESLIKLLFESLSEKTERKEYKQFIYKYDDSIGIYNQNDTTYNSFKSENLETNSHFVFEKITKDSFINPPVLIDDMYYENVLQYQHFKIIGNKLDKHNIIVEFMFNHNDYSKFINIIRTDYKSLFEKLDLSFLKSYFGSLIDKSYSEPKSEAIIHKSTVGTQVIDKSIRTKYIDSKRSDSKPSKYQTKNTTKYEPKYSSSSLITGTRTVHDKYEKYDSHKKHDKRFESRISFVPRVD